MASSRQVLLLFAVAVAAAACLATTASAMEWKVGDDGGWRGKFNETGWAKDKMFMVGDTLLFSYTPGKHTVIQVGKADFAACNLKANHLGAWYSGNDVVALDTPGKKWFICDIPTHCDELGMKLVIDVMDGAPTSPPQPKSSAPAITYATTAGAALAAAVVAAAALAL